MITVPTFPTDNLYKFMALAGMLFFCISLIYPEYRRIETRDSTAAVQKEIDKYFVENDKSIDRLEKLKEQINMVAAEEKELRKALDKKLLTRREIENADESRIAMSNNLSRIIKENKSINEQMDLRNIEISTSMATIRNQQFDLSQINTALKILGRFSLGLTTLGFLLWYHKTQSFQDKVLKEQAGIFLENNNCQSCGMQLKDQLNYLYFSEEEKKCAYCKNCYSDQNFNEPDLTLDEMENRVKERLREIGYNRFNVYLMVNRLKNLERWKKKYNW